MSNNLRILPTHQTTSNHMMSAVNSQSLSTALTVISASIEGFTASKASILSDMCKRERCHCLCLQVITNEMTGIVVHSVYKPPNDQFAHILSVISIATVPDGVMTQQITLEKPLNSGQIHATSHSSMLLNYRNPLTVQDGKKATTHISSLHLESSRTCVRSKSGTLSRTPNTARSVLMPTQLWYHKLYLTDDVLTL